MSEPKKTSRAPILIRPVVGGLIAIVLVVILELTHVPTKLLWASPKNLYHGFVHTFRLLFVYCALPIGYILLVGALETGWIKKHLPLWMRGAGHVFAAATVASQAYRIFIAEPAFQAYWQFPYLFTVFAFALGFVGVVGSTHFEKRWLRWISYAMPPLTLVGGIGVHYANYIIERHQYPPFHYAALMVALAVVGSAGVQFGARGWLPGLRRWYLRVPFGLLLAAPFVVLLIPTGEAGAKVRRYVHARTALGQARLVMDPESETIAERRTRMVDQKAVARLAEHGNLPKLPEDFRLEDHHILLVTVETLRHDVTSMADPESNLTPNLSRLADLGAFSYDRAYSPSSTTLQSIGSIMTMRFPAEVPLKLEHTWKGALKKKALTVAELMSKRGWLTWAVIHNHHRVFTERIFGLGQGFEKKKFVLEKNNAASARSIDKRIIDEAIKRLEELSAATEPAFGWVFMSSPHHPYVSHEGKAWDGTKLERYKEEVQNADRQFGRLLDFMERTGRLDDTIIIVAGDHGEEFGEHGAKHHAATVYEEVVRVPLYIRIPGIQGTRIEEPTSLTYILPWFLRTSEDAKIRGKALNALKTYIGPILRASQGAVVVELIGKTRHFTAMVDGDYKVIYDHFNGIHEAYDLAADPGEQDDRMLEGDARFDAIVERFPDYIAVKESFERFEFEDPTPRKRKRKRTRRPKPGTGAEGHPVRSVKGTGLGPIRTPEDDAPDTASTAGTDTTGEGPAEPSG